MAQEYIATMTCVALGQRHIFLTGHAYLNGCVKTASRSRPIAVVPEGLIVRYPGVSVNLMR